jgi:hypothetical protein
MSKKYKIPVILYESEDQALPYIEIEQDDEMPPSIFIQEYKHTGEFEPGVDGEEQSIVDINMHMYVNMEFLKTKVTPQLYDVIRTSIGLKPVVEARAEGQKILDKVYGNVNERMATTVAEKEKIKEEVTKRFNEKLTGKFFKEESDKESDKE